MDFVYADMPDANTLTIGIFATLAQHERELISERTKKALAAKLDFSPMQLMPGRSAIAGTAVGSFLRVPPQVGFIEPQTHKADCCAMEI